MLITNVPVPVPTEARSQNEISSKTTNFGVCRNESMNIPKKIMMEDEDPYNIGGYSSSDDDKNERYLS